MFVFNLFAFQKKERVSMKSLSLITISLCLNFITCNAFSQVSESELDNDKLQLHQNSTIITNENRSEDDILYAPVKFTPTGLKCFFNHKFNHPKYSEDFLPHNLSDLIHFLEYSKASNQNKRFIKTTIKIFNQKFKALAYLSAKEFTKFLTKLPSLIDYSFIANIDSDQVKVKNILYNEFFYKYQFFKDDPLKFFNNLSEQICQCIVKDAIEMNDISAEDLRSSLVRFIETGCSKMVWFIEDEPDIWTQFKETCQAIYNLKEYNIIYDYEDINDIIHSALERFLFVLDVRGSNLPVEFFEKVWREINNNPPSWLEIEEIDELMETKKTKLLQAIKKTHTKAIGRQQFGIISGR